jgi:hypothetical protein
MSSVLVKQHDRTYARSLRDDHVGEHQGEQRHRVAAPWWAWLASLWLGFANYRDFPVDVIPRASHSD